MHQKKKKNQILSKILNDVLEDSEESYPSNAFLAGESVTMLSNLLIKIKGRNWLDGTRNKIQIRKAITIMKIVMDFQIVTMMNEVMSINL